MGGYKEDRYASIQTPKHETEGIALPSLYRNLFRVVSQQVSSPPSSCS